MGSRSGRFQLGARIWLIGVALSSPAWAVSPGVQPDAASKEQQSKAQERYEDGVQHYKAKRFKQAAEAFSASHAIVASPNSHMMRARALREAGELGPAYEEFALTQAEASELAVRLPRYASAAETAEKEQRELLSKVAALSLEVIGEANDISITVGSREVPPERWKAVVVSPGSVDVQARLPGGRRVWQTVQAKLGEVTTVTLDLEAASTEPEGAAPSVAPLAPQPAPDAPGDTATSDKPLRPFAYIAGGVGAVGILTFAVAGSLSRSTYNGLKDDCTNDVCSADKQSDIDRGKSQQTIANVGLVVGILGLGAGVTLFVLDETREKKRAGRSLKIQSRGSWLGVSGSF